MSNRTMFSGTFYRGMAAACAGHLLTPSSEGTFGSGVYLADFAAATLYADDGFVGQFAVRMDKPYHYSVPHDDSDFGDMPGIPLVKELFPLEGERMVADAVSRDSYYFGSEIEEAIVQLGFDGLVVTYYDGSQEIVALRNTRLCFDDLWAPRGEQIENATRITPLFLRDHLKHGITIQQWLPKQCPEKLFASAS